MMISTAAAATAGCIVTTYAITIYMLHRVFHRQSTPTQLLLRSFYEIGMKPPTLSELQWKFMCHYLWLNNIWRASTKYKH